MANENTFKPNISYTIGQVQTRDKIDVVFNKDYPVKSPKGKTLIDEYECRNTTEFYQKNPFNFPRDILFTVFEIGRNAELIYFDSGTFDNYDSEADGLGDELIPKPQLSELLDKINRQTDEMNAVKNQVMQYQYEVTAKNEKIASLQEALASYRENGSGADAYTRKLLEESNAEKRELITELNEMRSALTAEINQYLIQLKQREIELAAKTQEFEAFKEHTKEMDKYHDEYQAKLDGIDEIREDRKAKTLEGLLTAATAIVTQPQVLNSIGNLFNKWTGGKPPDVPPATPEPGTVSKENMAGPDLDNYLSGEE